MPASQSEVTVNPIKVLPDEPQPIRPTLNEYLRQHNRIPGLDAMRACSAAAVVLAHTLLPRQIGSMAVTVFFVISGFLITWLLLKESDATGRISLPGFYKRRTFRIFPAFYGFWIVAIGAAALRHVKQNWPENLAAGLYCGDYYYAAFATTGGIMGITWSLGIEEKFYLLWPWVFRRCRMNLQVLLRIVVLVIAIIWLYRIVIWTAIPIRRDYLRYAFEARFDNLLFGCSVAIALWLGLLDKVLERYRSAKFIPALMIACLTALALAEEQFGPGYYYTVGMSVDLALICVLMLSLIQQVSSSSSKWLEAPLFRFGGRISYSLYLYHTIMLQGVRFYGRGLPYKWQLVAIYSGSIVAAYMSYRFVESPFLRRRERL